MNASVGELVDELLKAIKNDPDVAKMKISMEGCDCYGDWGGTIDVSEPYVTLNR